MKSYFVLNFDISEKLPSFRSWEPSLALSMSVKFVWDSDSLELDCWYEKLLILVLNFDISVFSENSGVFWWILNQSREMISLWARFKNEMNLQYEAYTKMSRNTWIWNAGNVRNETYSCHIIVLMIHYCFRSLSAKLQLFAMLNSDNR